ncbi:MAG: FKBP-type peptidyl-prolyl cis-trans isomerase [Rhodospirillaceae bacterium]|nr:FKBP-type peptidyl-prolyl cis-trans isomerase [Rhodospirillaceae bacterium]
MKIWFIAGAVVLALTAGFVIMSSKKSSAAEGGSWVEQQAAFLEKNAKQPGWKSTPSGLQYIMLKPAAKPGAKPAPGSEVTVHYEGRLIDGKVFDSSYKRNEPISFPLNGVITGWQEAVPMMHEGEVWEFAIPAELGYGARGAPGAIPGNSALIFKIELLKAHTPAK